MASGTVAFPDLGPDPQLAGFHAQSLDVQVAVDDAGFAHPTWAEVDPDAGTWTAVLPATDGSQLIVRALRDRFPSEVTTAAISPTDDGGGDGDGGTGDEPDCHKPDKGRARTATRAGRPTTRATATAAGTATVRRTGGERRAWPR